MQIYDCKVNHLTNPLGFRMTRTVFSWKVKDAQGKHQTEARIQVAADENMTELLNDTGWSTSLDSIASKVEMELKPVTRYYWTVSVRSDASVKNGADEMVPEEAVSPVQWFETGKREQPWTGKWITCNNKEPRHPIFEKKINLAKEVEKARLYICGLGLYEAYYNGKRIGDEYLTPYSTDYTQWTQYQTYDVTELVKNSAASGAETATDTVAPTTGLSILLGNGWYKGRFGFSEEGKNGYWGKEWKLIAELHLFYTDGTSEVIGTDESWTVRRSNITFSNLYDGEHQDDTLEPMPEEPAVLCDAPAGGVLSDRMSLPVRMHETFKPVELIHTPTGEKVFDLGQEFAGLFTLHVHEPKGTNVRFLRYE